MANKTIPNLDPVVTVAPTDRIGVRQAGDIEDKRETRAQFHALVAGEHFILALVDEAATPTLAFGDGDSGFFEDSDDSISQSIAGVVQAVTGPDGKLFINTITGGDLATDGNIETPTPADIVIFAAGSATDAVDGGCVEIWGGYAAGTAGTPQGGMVDIYGGGGGGGEAVGGDVRLFGGEATIQPGTVDIIGGTATVQGVGGAVNIDGGPGFGTNAAGGRVNVSGGDAVGSQAGGSVVVTGGRGGLSNGGGGDIFIDAGDAGSGTSGDGGDARLVAGFGRGAGVGGGLNLEAGAGGPTNADGGDINLTPGAGGGAGDDGAIIIAQTTAPAGTTDKLYNLAGVLTWNGIDITASGGTATALLGLNAAGPQIADIAPDFETANILPNQTDDDTGIGWFSADALILFAGGLAGLEVREVSSGTLIKYGTTINITANAGGGEPGAVLLVNSYNIIDTCASTGDSVRLPATFSFGSVITIKNDGAAACDVFPQAADFITPLAQGVADSIPAGESATYLGDTSNARWTKVYNEGGAAPSLDPFAAVSTTLSEAPGDHVANPTLAFGDGNTGIYEVTDNQLIVATQGVARIRISSSGIRTESTSDGWRLDTDSPVSGDPNIWPNQTDSNTGLGWAAPDVLELVAGGHVGISVEEVASLTQIVMPTGDAFIGGTGGSTAIRNSQTTFTAVAGFTITSAGLIPAGSIVLGITAIITTTFGNANGLTGITIGDGSTSDLFGTLDGILEDDGSDLTTTGWTAAVLRYPTANDVVVTGVGGTGFEDGVGELELIIHYLDMTAATS